MGMRKWKMGECEGKELGKKRVWSFEASKVGKFEGQEEMENEEAKGGAPFSGALKDKESITRKVLAVNVYLVCNSNDSGKR